MSKFVIPKVILDELNITKEENSELLAHEQRFPTLDLITVQTSSVDTQNEGFTSLFLERLNSSSNASTTTSVEEDNSNDTNTNKQAFDRLETLERINYDHDEEQDSLKTPRSAPTFKSQGARRSSPWQSMHNSLLRIFKQEALRQRSQARFLQDLKEEEKDKVGTSN